MNYGNGFAPHWLITSKTLTNRQKLLYILINTLSSKNGYCYAKNEFLAEQAQAGIRSIQRDINVLKNAGCIVVKSEKNQRKIACITAVDNDESYQPDDTNEGRRGVTGDAGGVTPVTRGGDTGDASQVSTHIYRDYKNINNIMSYPDGSDATVKNTAIKSNSSVALKDARLIEYYGLCKDFREHVERVSPHYIYKSHYRDKWANTFRLMVERDGRTIDFIKDLIVLVSNDRFWSKNILTPHKLRLRLNEGKLSGLFESKGVQLDEADLH